MSRFVLLAMLTGLVVAVVGCGRATADVAGTTWTLTELNGAAPIEGTTIDLTVSDGSVSGSSGCNRYVGSATVNDGALTLAPELAGTMMNCADDVIAQEQAFIESLLAVISYEVSDEALSLSDGDGVVVARFE